MPLDARDIAASRLAERQASVTRGLAAWFDAALARPDFDGVVLPLLRAAVPPLDASGGWQPEDSGRGGPDSAARGEQTEAAAGGLVRAALPPGWRLLLNAHVVALDGRHPGHHAACKWEADCVALDEGGTAVALFEVGTRTRRGGRGRLVGGVWPLARRGLISGPRAAWPAAAPVPLANTARCTTLRCAAPTRCRPSPRLVPHSPAPAAARRPRLPLPTL